MFLKLSYDRPFLFIKLFNFILTFIQILYMFRIISLYNMYLLFESFFDCSYFFELDLVKGYFRFQFVIFYFSFLNCSLMLLDNIAQLLFNFILTSFFCFKNPYMFHHGVIFL